METINKPCVIVYDGDKLEYIVGSFGSVEQVYDNISSPYQFVCDDVSRTTIRSARSSVLTMTIDESADCNTIKLDPTLMKRIAKYNKEKEIEQLEIKIKEKQEEIKELDGILLDKSKRVDKIKKYIADIYNIDTIDDDYDDCY